MEEKKVRVKLREIDRQREREIEIGSKGDTSKE